MLISNNTAELVAVHIRPARNYIVGKCQQDELKSVGVNFAYFRDEFGSVVQVLPSNTGSPLILTSIRVCTVRPSAALS